MNDDVRRVLSSRRVALAALVGEPFVVFAGRARPRNYPANRHRFRASSHFLHLVGAPIEDAILVLDGDRARLYTPDQDETDHLFHGHAPSCEELVRDLGLEVLRRSELPDLVGFAHLPSFDAALRAEQRALCGEPEPDRLARVVEATVSSRLRHDALARRELEQVAAVTALAHRAGLAATRPGRRASAVRAVMEAVFTSRGLDLAYPSIVTTRGDILHDVGGNGRLGHDDVLLMDVGGESALGYAADVTRTVPVGGSFDGAGREVYEAVLRAQAHGLSLVRPGARTRTLHEEATRSLAASLVAMGVLVGDPDERAADGSVALFFPHGIGHLLGLDVHDMEDLGDAAGYAPGRGRSTEPGLRYLRVDRDLEPDMAMTIEPGLYFMPALLGDAAVRERFAGRVRFDRAASYAHVRGIRIEDDVLVTSDGADVITSAAPKSLPELESWVGVGLDLDAALDD